MLSAPNPALSKFVISCTITTSGTVTNHVPRQVKFASSYIPQGQRASDWTQGFHNDAYLICIFFHPAASPHLMKNQYHLQVRVVKNRFAAHGTCDRVWRGVAERGSFNE